MQNSINLLTTTLQSRTISEICSLQTERLMDSHMALMNISTGLSVDKCIHGVKIFQLKKQMGENDLLKTLIFIVKNFCDSLNVKDSMNPLQMVEAAGEIMERFTHESIDDFILCLKKGKNGDYGPIYNKIDKSVLFTFWAKYLEEKSWYLENNNLNYKGLETNTLIGTGKNVPEKFKDKFAAIRETIQKRNAVPKQLRDKKSTNSLEAFLAELKEWLPASKPEERENLKKDAINKNASYVLKAIEEFENQ